MTQASVGVPVTPADVGQKAIDCGTVVVDGVTYYRQRVETYHADDHHIDAFGRLRVSNPTLIFESQFIYNLLPLLYEPITAGVGASIAHDATNRHAVMTFASTPTSGKAYMQTFAYHRYQPGKSQSIAISFNFIEQVANCLKFAGYSDGVNGIEFQNNGVTNRFVIYSGTSNGNQIANQADWNLDKLDGTGRSGITLDISKRQIVVIDFQALNSGRVRCGFDIGGTKVYCHEFNHANIATVSFVQNPNCPIRAGMTCTGTVSTTMHYNRCSVISEGGQEKSSTGLEFASDFAVVAGNGVRTHAISIRPRALFNGITNRHGITFLEIDLLVTGNYPVEWELCLGQAISGTTTFADVNTTWSSMEKNTAGTISGAPAIIIDESYVAASNQSTGQSSMDFTFRYPITLDAAGVARLPGTLTIVLTGIGGVSQCYGAVKWTEHRG